MNDRRCNYSPLVKLFNFEDLTIFGAGSEWFWAMLTLLALPITYLAVRHQLHAQRASNAFEQLTSLTDEWLSERMRQVRLRLCLGIRHGGDPRETELLASKVDHFFRKLELLHRQGYLETELLWTNFGEDVVRYWTVMADLIEKTRGIRIARRIRRVRGADAPYARDHGEAGLSPVRDRSRVNQGPAGLDHRERADRAPDRTGAEGGDHPRTAESRGA